MGPIVSLFATLQFAVAGFTLSRGVNAHVSGTLYVIYVIQAATAELPFPVALVVFHALGYGDAVVLAVVGAIFQFLLLG